MSPARIKAAAKTSAKAAPKWNDTRLVKECLSGNESAWAQLIDKYKGDDPALRIAIVFFGDAGGFFASSMEFFELWPKSAADVPADVLVDNHYRAAFTRSGDEIVVSVRHALRPSDGPPRRRIRFHSSKYEEAMSDLARESRRLRDDLISVAQVEARAIVDADPRLERDEHRTLVRALEERWEGRLALARVG